MWEVKPRSKQALCLNRAAAELCLLALHLTVHDSSLVTWLSS